MEIAEKIFVDLRIYDTLELKRLMDAIDMELRKRKADYLNTKRT